ncbi:hypothetical protein XM25_20185 [Devosia sp. H5989]|nr:hypothetical protein XM25_20185 [Devosia sp. H5989]
MEEIRLAPPDPQAASSFVAARERILPCFPVPPRLIEHIGSTAIPGILAKPVIDIVVLVDDLAQGHAAIPALEALGFSFWRDNPVRTRLFLVKGLPNRTHHLHIHADPTEVERHLVFRDHLRAHPGDSAAYEALKRELAERYRTDREAYTEGKSAFIDAIVARAGGPPRLREG